MSTRNITMPTKLDERIKEVRKFKQYIAKMIEHTGDGILRRYIIAKEDRRPGYVYWDDPNELVDRLRLLHA